MIYIRKPNRRLHQMSRSPQMRHPPPVVKSAWIEDSARARRKLPLAHYMVDGIFVQKGTLAASFAAAATPKKSPPPSSAASEAQGGRFSGGSTASSSQGHASSRAEVTKPRPSHPARTNATATGRLADSRPRVSTNAASRGVGEEAEYERRQRQTTMTWAEGASSGGGGNVPGVSIPSIDGGGGGGGSGGGLREDGSGARGSERDIPAAHLTTPPMSVRGRQQRPAAVESQPRQQNAAAATPLLPCTSRRPPEDGDDETPTAPAAKGGFESGGGKDGGERGLLLSNKPSEGGGDGGGVSGGSGGRKGKSKSSSNNNNAGGDNGRCAAPAPFELPEMGAAGEGGRSTKDDPAFMKTFFRNSRLHFIGVG